MIIYLAGGISGNLNPVYKRMSRSGDISVEKFEESIYHENFWRGGSQGILYMMN